MHSVSITVTLFDTHPNTNAIPVAIIDTITNAIVDAIANAIANAICNSNLVYNCIPFTISNSNPILLNHCIRNTIFYPIHNPISISICITITLFIPIAIHYPNMHSVSITVALLNSHSNANAILIALIDAIANAIANAICNTNILNNPIPFPVFNPNPNLLDHSIHNRILYPFPLPDSLTFSQPFAITDPKGPKLYCELYTNLFTDHKSMAILDPFSLLITNTTCVLIHNLNLIPNTIPYASTDANCFCIHYIYPNPNLNCITNRNPHPLWLLITDHICNHEPNVLVDRITVRISKPLTHSIRQLIPNAILNSISFCVFDANVLCFSHPYRDAIPLCVFDANVLSFSHPYRDATPNFQPYPNHHANTKSDLNSDPVVNPISLYIRISISIHDPIYVIDAIFNCLFISNAHCVPVCHPRSNLLGHRNTVFNPNSHFNVRCHPFLDRLCHPDRNGSHQIIDGIAKPYIDPKPFPHTDMQSDPNYNIHSEPHTDCHPVPHAIHHLIADTNCIPYCQPLAELNAERHSVCQGLCNAVPLRKFELYG